MPQRHKHLVAMAAGHGAMGAGLGTILALTLVAGNAADIADMIRHAADPEVTLLILVGYLASIFAVGATLTGLILAGPDRG